MIFNPGVTMPPENTGRRREFDDDDDFDDEDFDDDDDDMPVDSTPQERVKPATRAPVRRLGRRPGPAQRARASQDAGAAPIYGT